MALDPPHIDPPFTTWTNLRAPDKELLPMRLAGGDPANVTLFRAVTQPPPDTDTGEPWCPQLALTPLAMTGKAPDGIAFPQRLPNLSQFDTVALGNGRFAVAAESFDGAMNALVLCTMQNGKVADFQRYDHDADFRMPRFVRGDAAAGKVVTVINGVNLVELRPEPPTAQIKTLEPQIRTLAKADAGIAVATTPPNGMLKSAALFLFGEGSGEQSLAGDAVGTLTLSPFPPSRTGPSGATPATLFEPDTVYSFDVDVQGGTALVLASTASGPQLLEVDLAAGQSKAIAWPAGHPEPGAWIANPVVLALDGPPGSTLFALAFYELIGEEIRHISYATLDLATLP